jgi:hypothetical protein
MTDDAISDEEYERSAFQVVPIASLPATGVDLVGWPGTPADWRSVTRIAIAIFNAGIDPLDESAIRQEVGAARLDRRDRSWAIELFLDPIAIYAMGRRWSNGRHRVEAMRRADVPECLLKVLT